MLATILQWPLSRVIMHIQSDNCGSPIVTLADVVKQSHTFSDNHWLDRAACGGEAMLQPVQKWKLPLTDHQGVVGLPADPKHHYLECIFSPHCFAHSTCTSSWHHDLLYMGPGLQPAHLSPVSLYTPLPPWWTYIVAPSCYMWRGQFFLVMILDVGGLSSWLSYPEPLQLSEYALLFKDRCIHVYWHCLIMHSLMFKVLYRSLWVSVTPLAHLQWNSLDKRRLVCFIVC